MKNIKQRQIDTSVGLILGGLIGYTSQPWYLWLILLIVVIAWGYNLKKLDAVEKESENGKK